MEAKECAHPIIETKEEGVGVCMACGERVGLVTLNGQPIGYLRA